LLLLFALDLASISVLAFEAVKKGKLKAKEVKGES
jgi:hypothetical protein